MARICSNVVRNLVQIQITHLKITLYHQPQTASKEMQF